MLLLKTLLASALAASLTLIGTVGVGAAALYSQGTVSVEIDDSDGTHLDLHVPAGLLSLGLAAVPNTILVDPDLGADLGDEMLNVREELDRAGIDLDPLAHASREVLAELERQPDFVMVEVEGDDERVRIEKVGGKLRIHVESDDGRVSVEVPIRVIRQVARKLDRIVSAS